MEKKFITVNGLIIFLLLISSVFAAVTLTTIYGGGPNTGTDCGTGKVPLDNQTPKNGEIKTCVSHHYYNSYYYKQTTKNTNTMCNGEDRVVGKSGTKIKCQRYDDIAPTISWLSDNYYNANDSYEFIANDTGGSGYKKTINNGGTPITTTLNGFKVNISDLSVLDSGKGYKTFNIKVKVYDNAGNYTNYNKNIKVYANRIKLGGISSSINSTSNLSNGTKIADGTKETITIILKDEYGNEIVPVTGRRTVKVSINYNNNLYLNQYSQNGDGAVYIGNTQLSIGTNTYILTNKPNGIYYLDFKVFSPTENIYNKTKGNFKINNIKASISDFGGTETFSNLISFKFKPIYQTIFTNYGPKNTGFVEGINQTGSLVLNGANPTTTDKEIYLEFGKYDGNGNLGIDNVVNEYYNITNNNNNVSEGHKSSYSDLLKLNNFSTNYINTLLIHQSGNGNPSNSYLASIIKYKINGKTIVYPSDIVGKNKYFGTVLTNNTTNKGVKILGKSYNEKQKNIIEGQDKDINIVMGKITKATLRADIRSNAYKLIKNLGVSVGGNKELLKENVIYYRLDGGNIKYSTIDNKYGVTSGKTILVEGGNLIIDKDINISGIIGIVVLENSNKNGGKILVDNDVVKITATMYSDKVLVPSNGDRELLQSDGIGYFKNQLLIIGSIFSNNTLGGARYNTSSNKYVCPYYIKEIDCNMKEAQKYDLNFMRRFYIYNGNTIANGGKDYNGNTTYDSSLENSKYPLIIKYNPLIQTTPPPLFAK